MLLIQNPRVVFHLHVDFEMVARLDGQLNAQNLILVGDWFLDDQIIARCVLLNDTRLMDGINEELGTTVHDWSFLYINVNQHIINTHTAKRSQNMLDGINLHTAFAEGSTTGGIDDIVDICFDNGLVFKVNSTKTDSRIYGSRIKGEGAALAGMKPCSFDTDSIFERTLFLHKKSYSWIISTKNAQR